MNKFLTLILSSPQLLTSSIVMFVISTILFVFSKPLGAIAYVLSVIGSLSYYEFVKKNTKDYVDKLESLDEYFSDATRAAVFKMPFPMAMLTKQGTILWYNTKFKSLTGKEEIADTDIRNLLPEFKLEDIKDIKEEGKKSFVEYSKDDKFYNFYYNIVDVYDQEKQDVILLYGVDNSYDKSIINAYYRETPVIMIVQIDNYDEIQSSVDETNRPLVYAEIDKAINKFAVDYGGFARKYESDKYICIFRKEDFTKMTKDKFPITEAIKEAEAYSSIPPTLSIGVGTAIDTPLEVYKLAHLALDVALGRGGDQIVVNDSNAMSFYGGKKKAVEKHNKVKARVVANALSQLIDQSTSVYVMGHKNPDMDSFGSCLGLYSIVRARNKNCKIVLKEVTPAINSLYNDIKNRLGYIIEDIVSPEEAEEMVDNNSLVVVLDNHREKSTEAPALLDKTERLVLIDHHRRGVDYIEDPTLTYLEPYASSTSELITELIQYSEDDIEIETAVADGLLAGITVDTKAFTLQTGVRTFEAASVLKRFGADSAKVKRLFREPKNVVKERAKLVADSVFYKDIIAISRLEEQTENSVLIAAQAADSMLDIQGIKASFVLTYYRDHIHISARSIGEISVQLILEKIGGGGHQTSAGAQLSGIGMNAAEEVLIKAIDDYLKEEEKDESNT